MKQGTYPTNCQHIEITHYEHMGSWCKGARLPPIQWWDLCADCGRILKQGVDIIPTARERRALERANYRKPKRETYER